jgi:ketol-acid reductoisomerase
LAFGIGSQHLFDTTFQQEVWSDLTGERMALMGAIQGLFKAQYDVLRENGHSASESFNETVEEFTRSLIRLFDENGMDFMYRNCSDVAREGAVYWAPKIEEVVKPVIRQCYKQVISGEEVKRVILCNQDPNYKKLLDEKVEDIAKQEIWQIGKQLRELR